VNLGVGSDAEMVWGLGSGGSVGKGEGAAAALIPGPMSCEQGTDGPTACL
jgi:hypothetical protein